MTLILATPNKKNAEKTIRKLLKRKGYECGKSKEISFGLQLEIKFNNSKIGYLRIYESKKHGVKLDTSQIFENEHKRRIFEIIEKDLGKKEEAGAIPLPQRRFFRYPRDKKAIIKIEKMLISEFNGKKLQPHENKIYFIKVNGLTISQFRTGTWVIQGRSSELADEIIRRVNQIYEEVSRKELLRILKLNLPMLKQIEYENVVKELEKFEIDITKYIHPNIYSYLNPNDRIEIRDGILLLEYVKSRKLPLLNFACLVRNFAIAYEGFLIKLLSELNLIDPSIFLYGKPANIGAVLKPQKDGLSKLEKEYQSYFRVKPALPKKIWSYWQECRNDYLHSDFVKFPRVEKVEDAESKIREIIGIMKDCLEIFGRIIKPTLEDVELNEEAVIGIDEAGKGDYFGPLVVAAVYVDRNSLRFLSSIGVRDSKSLSDSRVSELYKKISNKCKIKIVKINPKKYNDLYKQIRNLNQLLAWGHARALENILSEVKCNYAISDQFGDENLVKSRLMQLGKTILLIQRPEADKENIAVAAASIVARHIFLRELKALSESYQLHFPKGSSKDVEKAAKEFIKKYGKGKLDDVAKLHFKISKRLK
jgi:ribonuclease HIII